MRGDGTPHSHFTWLASGFTQPRPEAARGRLLAPAGRSLYIRAKGTRNRRAVLSPPAKLMLNEVYNSRILELAGNIPRLGRLADPPPSATAHSKLFGSPPTADPQKKGGTAAHPPPPGKTFAPW